MAPSKPLGRRASKAIPRPPIVEVAEAIKTRFGPLIADTAICLRTPVPETVAVSGVALPAPLREFVVRYEPKTKEAGLYSHQARILEQLGKKKLPNVVLTTATGSGKSLAFWAWVFEALRRDPRATAIACFPTQALLWGQADRMARLSDEESLVIRGEQPYAGTITLGKLTVPWTVWHGTQESRDMRDHQESDDFLASRLRITTVDKVHWSLFHSKHADFLQGLRAVVLDEAHIWHGLAGANVRAIRRGPPEPGPRSRRAGLRERVGALLLSVQTGRASRWRRADPQRRLSRTSFSAKRPKHPTLEPSNHHKDTLRFRNLYLHQPHLRANIASHYAPSVGTRV